MISSRIHKLIDFSLFLDPNSPKTIPMIWYCHCCCHCCCCWYHLFCCCCCIYLLMYFLISSSKLHVFWRMSRVGYTNVQSIVVTTVTTSGYRVTLPSFWLQRFTTTRHWWISTYLFSCMCRNKTKDWALVHERERFWGIFILRRFRMVELSLTILNIYSWGAIYWG